MLPPLLLAAASFIVTEPFTGMVLRHHATPEKHQIETMPGGVAALDYAMMGAPTCSSRTARHSRR